MAHVLLDDFGFSDSLLRFQAVGGLAVRKLEIVLQSLLKSYCLPCLYYFPIVLFCVLII